MYVRMRAGRQAGQVVYTPAHIGKVLIADGRAELPPILSAAEAAIDVAIPEQQLPGVEAVAAPHAKRKKDTR